MTRTQMLSLFAAAMLSACAAAPPSPAPPAPASASVPAFDGLASLPAQNLRAGECGLFLWTVSAPRALVLFTKAGSNTADASLPGGAQTLTLARQSGDLFAQFMTRLDYAAPDGGKVHVALEPGERIEGGQRTRAAQVTIVPPDGWETLVPAAGLAACLPADDPA